MKTIVCQTVHLAAHKTTLHKLVIGIQITKDEIMIFNIYLAHIFSTHLLIMLRVLTVTEALESELTCLMLDPLAPMIAPTAEFGTLIWHNSST